MSDLYCILPSGNQSEFPELDAELIARGLAARYSLLRCGGRLYHIPADQIHLLPQDHKGPYLGDNNSGHSIYKMSRVEYNRVQWGGSDWIPLTPAQSKE